MHTCPVLSDDPTSFTITVTSDPGDNGESELDSGFSRLCPAATATFQKMSCFLFCAAVEATIKFTYVEKYPDEPPLWEIHSQENLEASDAQDILTLLQQQVGPQDHLQFSNATSSESSWN